MAPPLFRVATANTIIVIGTSAGGVEALRRLIAGFDPNWPVSVFITIHTGKNRNRMPEILNWGSRLPARFAEHQKSFGRGIYIAPPDRHLIVENGTMLLSAGPKENHARPAIDPMFRSAARHHGRRVIGVLLTGYLYDGMNGLYEIQKSGGTTIVQDKGSAKYDGMPNAALETGKVDAILPPGEIARRLPENWYLDFRWCFA